MKKLKIITNILIVSNVILAILFSLFVYKFYSLKGQIRESAVGSTLHYQAYDSENNLILDKEVNDVAGLNLYEVLKKDEEVKFKFTMIIAIKGLEQEDGPGARAWFIYSETHSACKNAVGHFCGEGAGTMYLGMTNSFVFKYEVYGTSIDEE
ncbi:hypothetical protein SCHIN_v1c10670 [Spiroplasma chinense]|uniref:DUF4430 domain-containing protein n=1 Tax=Spiroplasma chinense TaxID=216932 RepID=A0A5B9Y5N2_9MOLU|nr:hypothetical protein [Spiroplasma chinense]QEH62260.1 hypothetical protein SCHIN_v1c10670 [Spiroplasma chinense]